MAKVKNIKGTYTYTLYLIPYSRPVLEKSIWAYFILSSKFYCDL